MAPEGALLTTIGNALTTLVSGLFEKFELIAQYLFGRSASSIRRGNGFRTLHRGEDRDCIKHGLSVGCCFLDFVVRLFHLDVPPTALADGGHYRELAGRLRELARPTPLAGARKELTDLARRYDLRGDFLDRRAR
jgi:hypothetical protein